MRADVLLYFRKHTLTVYALALIIFVLVDIFYEYKGLGSYIGFFYYKIDDYVITH